MHPSGVAPWCTKSMFTFCVSVDRFEIQNEKIIFLIPKSKGLSSRDPDEIPNLIGINHTRLRDQTRDCPGIDSGSSFTKSLTAPTSTLSHTKVVISWPQTALWTQSTSVMVGEYQTKGKTNQRSVRMEVGGGNGRRLITRRGSQKRTASEARCAQTCGCQCAFVLNALTEQKRQGLRPYGAWKSTPFASFSLLVAGRSSESSGIFFNTGLRERSIRLLPTMA